jgi:hypothetical protein
MNTISKKATEARREDFDRATTETTPNAGPRPNVNNLLLGWLTASPFVSKEGPAKAHQSWAVFLDKDNVRQLIEKIGDESPSKREACYLTLIKLVNGGVPWKYGYPLQIELTDRHGQWLMGNAAQENGVNVRFFG